MLAASRQIVTPVMRRGVATGTRVVPRQFAAPPPPFFSLSHQRCWFAGGGDDDDDNTPPNDPLEDMILDGMFRKGGRESKQQEMDDILVDDTRRPTRGISPKSAKAKYWQDEYDDDEGEKPATSRRYRSKPHKMNFETEDPHLELLELHEEDDADAFMAEQQPTELEIKTRRAERKEEMDHKKGRGWTDPWDLDEVFASNETYEDLPDWTPELVSRISQERVKILDEGIPTLEQLARLPLPPPPHPHPGHGHTKAYALHRNRHLYKQIAVKVEALAAPRIPAIQALSTWQDKQDAVDELFERIEFTLQEQEAILGKHPQCGYWVEKALESYLKSMQRNKEQGADPNEEKAVTETSEKETDEDTMENEENKAAETTEGETNEGEIMRAADEEAESPMTSGFPTESQDETATPLFMDCFNADQDNEEDNIPKILHPLAPLARGANQGRMMEEWEMAAHKTTKRIMLRHSTRSITQFMETHQTSRILVAGRKGTGKTAALLSLVAAARKSGHIVMFVPHCSMLAEFGFYIEPNEHRPGFFDLPVLSEQMCNELLTSHKEDLASIPVDTATLEVFFSPDQLAKTFQDGETSISVADLVSTGAEKRAVAAMCYSAAIDTLMKQDSKPLTMVIVEFNTLYHAGQYFHEDYDEQVRKPIPYNKINLFQPILEAMGLVASETELLPEPVLMKRGAIIAGMSGSKPVGDKINAGLETSAKECAAATDTNMLLAYVPRLTNLEVDHVMANYEAIGFGKLRLDQGQTVTNAQEVAYLRTISSSNSQELMKACVL